MLAINIRYSGIFFASMKLRFYVCPLGPWGALLLGWKGWPFGWSWNLGALWKGWFYFEVAVILNYILNESRRISYSSTTSRLSLCYSASLRLISFVARRTKVLLFGCPSIVCTLLFAMLTISCCTLIIVSFAMLTTVYCSLHRSLIHVHSLHSLYLYCSLLFVLSLPMSLVSVLAEARLETSWHVWT
jgi:hypothetical protein